MSAWCPNCGRRKEDHQLEGGLVRGPNGMEIVKWRVCPVVRRRGPSLPLRPDVYAAERSDKR